MNTWEYLVYAESVETNRRLETIEKDNEAYRESQKQSRLNNNISYLFQELYKNKGDISKVNLSSVETLKQDMSYRYHTRFNRPKPKANLIYVFVSLLMLLLIMSTEKPSLWVIVPVAIIVYCVYEIINIGNSIEFYEKNIQNKKDEVYKTRLKYSNLSTYGLYAKYYIDFKTKDILALLIEQDKGINVYLARGALYKLFGFKDSGREDLSYILQWNRDLISLYDAITPAEAQEYLKKN